MATSWDEHLQCIGGGMWYKEAAMWNHDMLLEEAPMAMSLCGGETKA